MRRLARHVQRAAALLVAALFWFLMVFVVTPCNAGNSTGTVYGNFQDVFGAGFNPQITWHPVALFIPTNEPTPLYKDRKMVPNSTNAAQSFFYARDGSFAISNLWTGSYVVYADGTDQSYNCYVQSGTWTFNQTLTNNQFPTNGGLVFVAGSNVTLTQFGNTVTISTSSVSDGGTVTNLTIITNISQTIITTNLTVVNSGSASNLTVTNNLDLPYIQAPSILKKGSGGITGIALDGTNSELFNGAGGFSILSPQFQMTLDGKMSLRPGFRATNIASVGGYQISDGGESSFDNSGIWDLENPNGSALFYLGNSPNATNAQVYAGTFYGSFKVAGTLSGFPGATIQIGDIGGVNPINNIHSTNAFTGNETVSNLFDLLGAFEVNNTNAPAGQVFTSLGSGNAAFRPASSGGGGSQTPLTNDVDAAFHSITNATLVSAVEVQGEEFLAANTFGLLENTGSGLSPAMGFRFNTNFQGANFTFLAPNGSDFFPGYAVLSTYIVSNTSSGSITASFPSSWSNNWQGGGGTATIGAHGILAFDITVNSFGPLALTNVSWKSSGGSGTVTSGDGVTTVTNTYGVVSIAPQVQLTNATNFGPLVVNPNSNNLATANNTSAYEFAGRTFLPTLPIFLVDPVDLYSPMAQDWCPGPLCNTNFNNPYTLGTYSIAPGDIIWGDFCETNCKIRSPSAIATLHLGIGVSSNSEIMAWDYFGSYKPSLSLGAQGSLTNFAGSDIYDLPGLAAGIGTGTEHILGNLTLTGTMTGNAIGATNIQGTNVFFNTIGSGSGNNPTPNMAFGAVGSVGTNSQSGSFTFGAPINVNTAYLGAFSSFMMNVTNTSGSPIVATGLSTWKTNAVLLGGWSITNDAVFTVTIFYGIYTNVLYLPIN